MHVLLRSCCFFGRNGAFHLVLLSLFLLLAGHLVVFRVDGRWRTEDDHGLLAAMKAVVGDTADEKLAHATFAVARLTCRDGSFISNADDFVRFVSFHIRVIYDGDVIQFCHPSCGLFTRNVTKTR